MNNVYFACHDCRVMVDAGYRWAYWELEHPGVVERGRPLSIQAVLGCTSYWSPAGDEPGTKQLLDEVLPLVRSFLEEHGAHRLSYGDEEEILGVDPVAGFDWIELGRMPEISPRYLAEVMGLRSWAEVLAWGKGTDWKPWCHRSP